MRSLILVTALLALPVAAAAQQADAALDPVPPPRVQLEQSATTVAAPALDATAAEAPQAAVEALRVPADPPALQGEGPESKEWWWLVGAIVAGGLILAILL